MDLSLIKLQSCRKESRPAGGGEVKFMENRSSGIVLHITSLPGDYGIGSMGREARSYVDFLQRSGQQYWQILPLNPIGLGNSPYMTTSVFAGNPLIIDLDELAERGLLTWDEVATARSDWQDLVDFDRVWRTRPTLLELAYHRADRNLLEKVKEFQTQQEDWLPDYCMYMAAKDHFGGKPLLEWPDKDLVHRKPEAMAHYRTILEDRIGYYAFTQYIFFDQWHRLHAYANNHGVKIIGDLPIYVSGDSSDVWAHPELFQLDEDLQPTRLGGVPADSFNIEGQRWGNPLYNWEVHAADGYHWWCRRVKQSMQFYDVIRFDHFRGFDTYWAIDPSCKNALIGTWEKGPGMDLINAIRSAVPEADFIAEDLGVLSHSAYQLVKDSGLPGMRVLVDAFDPSGNSSFLPHNCPKNAIMYTSTHDNATFVQWLTEDASPEQREFATKYLRLRADEGYGWGAICGAWGSPCVLAMTTMQDVLGLGGDARMNMPGTCGGRNWGWRVRREALNEGVSGRLLDITRTYCRVLRE